MKGQCHLPRGDNNEIAKYIEILKNLLQNHWANFNQTTQENPWVKWIRIFTNKKHPILKKGIFFFLNKRYGIALQKCVSQVCDVSHCPLVLTLVDVYRGRTDHKVHCVDI